MKVLNPISGNYVSDKSKIGKLIVSNSTSTPQNCGENLVFDSLSGECIPSSSREGKIISALRSPKGCSRYKKRGEFVPSNHQQEVKDYFIENGDRGILLYWGLGAGKTCGSIIIADELIRRGMKRIFVFSSGSLRESFVEQYCAICGEGNQNLLRFVSYNYSKIEEILPLPEELDDSVIIIDEVHNLINGVRNESQNSETVYSLISDSKNSRIIALSGTPISKDEMDIFFIAKLLSPTSFEDESFISYFTGNRDKRKLKKIVQRFISTFQPPEDLSFYPKVKVSEEKVPITEFQLPAYRKAREFELEVHPPNESYKISNPEKYNEQKALFYIAYSLIKSRKACNLVYPSNYTDETLDEEFIMELDQWAPKFSKVINSIISESGKHLVYSEFKSSSGVQTISKILTLLGIGHLLFTGDLTDNERRSVVTKFNSEDNLRGEKYKVLLITDAGAEGQNFLQVRKLHILEQSIDELKIKQVIGRCVRYLSHSLLPKKDRNVEVIRYFSTIKGEKSSDELAFAIGKKRFDQVMVVINLLDSLDVVG